MKAEKGSRKPKPEKTNAKHIPKMVFQSPTMLISTSVKMK